MAHCWTVASAVDSVRMLLMMLDYRYSTGAEAVTHAYTSNNTDTAFLFLNTIITMLQYITTM